MHTNNRVSDFWFHHPLAFVSRWSFFGALLGLVATFLVSLVYAVILFLLSRINESVADVFVQTAPLSILALIGYVPVGLLLGGILGAVTALVEKPWWDGCDDCEVVTDEEIAEMMNDGVVVEETPVTSSESNA